MAENRGLCQVCRVGGIYGIETANVKGVPGFTVQACVSCYTYDPDSWVSGKGFTYTVTEEQAESTLNNNYWFLRKRYMAHAAVDEHSAKLLEGMVRTVTLDYPDLDAVVAEKWPKSKVKNKRPESYRALGGLMPINGYAMTLIFIAYMAGDWFISPWVILFAPVMWYYSWQYSKHVGAPKYLARREKKWKEARNADWRT